MYLDRGLEARLQASLKSAPLVIVEGARATGKTRLVEHAIERGWLAETRSFLNPAELNAAQASPREYVFGLPHGTAIDEAQLCEDILLPVKERVEKSEAGALLLTGSTRLRRDELGGSDPLAGRVGRPLHLGPLTVGERSGTPTQLVKQLFDDDPQSIAVGPALGRTDLIDLVQEPGMPGWLDDDLARRNDLATAYIPQVTNQSSFASVDSQRVNQLARYLAGRTSTLVNINGFATGAELNRESVEKYLAHLEEALVVLRLPGWRRTKDKSETDKAKVHFFDAGIACAVAAMKPREHDEDLGRLVETLLVTDLVRQSRWLSDAPACFHWRRSNRDEVDLVLESSDGRAVCVEVKAAESVSKQDFRGIDAFRKFHPTSFHRGFVFYSGRNVQPFGDGRWAMPIAALRPAADEPAPSMRTNISMNRESTDALWTRVLGELITRTRGTKIEWDDTRVPGAYTTATGSGSISVAPRLAGMGGIEVPMPPHMARVTGEPRRIVLSMDDAKGETISVLAAEEPSIQLLATTAPGRYKQEQALYKLACELVDLIEVTPSRASSVADDILGDLAD